MKLDWTPDLSGLLGVPPLHCLQSALSGEPLAGQSNKADQAEQENIG